MTDENTKAHPGPFDGMESAKPDEPVFTLQGGDPLAPELVRGWAEKARERAIQLRKDGKEEKADALLIKATEAEKISWNMESYAKGEKEVRAHEEGQDDSQGYLGGSLPEDTARRAQRHRLLRAAADRLSNAGSEGCDWADQLEEIGLAKFGDPIRKASKRLIGLARQLEPARMSREDADGEG